MNDKDEMLQIIGELKNGAMDILKKIQNHELSEDELLYYMNIADDANSILAGTIKKIDEAQKTT